MSNEYPVINSTPRGNHWIGTSAATTQSSVYRNSRPSSRQHSSPRVRNNITERKKPIAIYDTTSNVTVERKVPPQEQDLPLISSEILEPSRQRLLAVIIFCIIQSYKFYDLILLKTGLPVSGFFLHNNKENFIFKYFIADTLFFYLLPMFNIPKLQFKFWTVFLQIVISGLITVFASSEKEFVLAGFFSSIWRYYHSKELTLSGASVNQQKMHDSSAYFKGALTIKILPENTAMLNPLQEAYCLSTDDILQEVAIPIRVNSTAGIKFIQLEVRDLETNGIKLMNLTDTQFKTVDRAKDTTKRRDKYFKHSGANIMDMSDLAYLEIKLNQTGLYRIRKIIDSKGLALRVRDSSVLLVRCPTASVTGREKHDQCVGDSNMVSLNVIGVPPLKLRYRKIIGNEEYSFTDTNLEPQSFNSPLQAGPSGAFSIADMDSLDWAKPHNISITLNSQINHIGKYGFEIDKVTDALGNVVDFSSIPSKMRKEYGLEYDFISHSIPRASLHEKFDSNSPTKKKLIVTFEETAGHDGWKSDKPYSGEVQVNLGEGKQKVLNFNADERTYEFSADVPGTYSLETVRSNYCPGIINGKSQVIVSQPIPPEVNIKSRPINDDCVGQVGLEFDLSFTGVPPFFYVAKVYKMDGNHKKLYETKKLTSKGTRNKFSYTPKLEGQYIIDFDHLSNTLFTDPISLVPSEKFSFQTSMRAKPGASLKIGQTKELCLNDAATIPVVFQGEPPFLLKYEIVESFSSKRTEYTVSNITSFTYNIQTPSFSLGGDFLLSLISVQDASSCLVTLIESEAKIKVRRDVPSVSFNSVDESNEIKVKKGSKIELPLKLSGDGPYVVKYQYSDIHGKISDTREVKFQSHQKPSLKVAKAGIYKLLGVQDSSCKGRVADTKNTFRVSYFARPSFFVLDQYGTSKLTNEMFMKAPVCQGSGGSVNIKLSGSSPFLVKYDIVSPKGKKIERSINAATEYVTISIPNTEAGEYTVIIKGVYDSNYAETDIASSDSKAVHTVIKQKVNPRPVLKFAEKNKVYKSCLSTAGRQAESLEPISLEANNEDGVYSVTFNIYHESTGRTDRLVLHNISVANFPYQRLYEGLGLGNHIVNIEKIKDDKNCENNLVGTGSDHISIVVADAPKIYLTDSNAGYCVGDYVSYQLTGAAPFIIRYEFNGVRLKSKEYSSQFVRLASEPGTISINSIEDSLSQCQVDFTGESKKAEFDKLSLTIHPIPSVTVSQGLHSIEDIHEGDQAEVVFTFTGTPPFSLTYVRTEETDSTKESGRAHVIETHKVTDIYSYQYKVMTSLQGTYEAIGISDAFCSAKNDLYFNN